MTARPLLAAMAVAAVMFATVIGGAASAAPAPVGLGTAGSFAVLAGSAVTNTGPTVISGDLGVSPGTAITGRPPMLVNGSVHAADAVAAQAQSDLTTAYNDAAGRTPATVISGDLGGRTLVPGVYQSASSLALTGTVTLDGQGDVAAVFVFQVGSTLTTATSSSVQFVSGAQACNVFWQVGSSATLGTRTDFAGNVLALTSVTLNTGATVAGRVLARNGAVTLDSNLVSRPSCAAPVTTTTAAPTITTTSTTPSTSTTTTQPPTTTMTHTTRHDLIPPVESPISTSTAPPLRLCEPSNVTCPPTPPTTMVPPATSTRPVPPVSLVPPRVLPPTGSPATGRLVVLGFAALAAGLGLRSLRR